MKRNLLITSLVLAGALAMLFWKSFVPGWVLFSNDGPYGGLINAQSRQPDAFDSIWADSNWLGVAQPTPGPSISTAMNQPFFLPVVLLLASAAWTCYRLGCLRKALGCFFIGWALLIVVAMICRPPWIWELLPISGFVFLIGLFVAGLRMDADAACTACDGTGYAAASGPKVCYQCKGTGMKIEGRMKV